MSRFSQADLVRLLRGVNREVMTGAISQLGLKVRKWDADEVLEFADFVIGELPLPAFVVSYLGKWFPAYRVVLQAYIANSIIQFLSALPGDEIEVTNLIAPEYYDDIEVLDENPPPDPQVLQEQLELIAEDNKILKDLNGDLSLENRELQETEADLRDHIETLKSAIFESPDGGAPPQNEEKKLLALISEWESAYRKMLGWLVEQINNLSSAEFGSVESGKLDAYGVARAYLDKYQRWLLSRDV